MQAITYGNSVGDPKYRVPPLEPLEIEEMSLTQGSSNFGLSFTARNVIIAGLKNVQVKDIRYLHKQHDSRCHITIARDTLPSQSSMTHDVT
jgi:hypothetical protein